LALNEKTKEINENREKRKRKKNPTRRDVDLVGETRLDDPIKRSADENEG